MTSIVSVGDPRTCKICRGFASASGRQHLRSA